MNYSKDISVIIPHRNSVNLLKKLFETIPDRDGIEIIIVDNSPIKISKSEIDIDREYQLLYSEPQRGAGGARNEGVKYSHGKWLVFADADDFFTSNAFDLFYSKIDSEADIIYTGMGGVYLDSGEPSTRGDEYAEAVHNYVIGKLPEDFLRYRFSTPCCKMVRHSLVDDYNICYDEVVASNDVYFSMLCGYYAKKIEAIDEISYIATVSKGTLTKRRDILVIKSRFLVALRYNKFLRAHGKAFYQRSIMKYIYDAYKCGVKYIFVFFWLLIKYGQNPFVGCRNWINTAKMVKINGIKENKYIVK